MKQGLYKIISNKNLTESIYEMRLEGNTTELERPGQFVNVKIDDLYLRRPISVCDYDERSITLIYKVVGAGTEKMSKITAGGTIDLLTGLGNGYDTSVSGQYPLLVGGGVGIPPLYNLCLRLAGEGKHVRVILGFNRKEEIFYREEFSSLGVQVFVTTCDGSCGTQGYVTDMIKKLDGYSSVYACGPLAMLRAVCDCTDVPAQFSFEEKMGCGFGACMGCSCKTMFGYKRVCKEGPVFFRRIKWTQE